MNGPGSGPARPRSWGRAAWIPIACVLAAACARHDPPPAGPPDVLVVTVDTLRADHLGAYGYALETSPRIDALAARGVRFADCTVQRPKTWPSIAALLTGTHPKTNGVRMRTRTLGPGLPVLAERFRDAGFATGAVVANFNIGRRFGYDRGFQHFVESWQEAWRKTAGNEPFSDPLRVKDFTNGTIVTDQALDWLGSLAPAKPFFLWLHYIDPHGPYLPPPAYAKLFEDAHPPEPAPLAALPRYQLQTDPVSRGPIDDLGFYKRQYDREIRYLDDEVGRLFDGLARLERAAGTLIVLTADHGESLGEHAYYLEHGQLSYQEDARVPLILAQEGRIEGGRVIEPPVGVIDVAPTILDLAGLAVPPGFEGQSLAGLVLGEPGARAPEHVFMESGYRRRPQLTVREGRFKLIRVPSPADRRIMRGTEFELYDVIADPGERRNLAAEHPEVVTRLAGVLDAWYGTAAGGAPEPEAGELDAISPEERRLLEALGYLDPAP